MNPVEAIAVAFGVASVWLTIREHPWCWPVGLVNVTLFAVLFWQSRIYGAAVLQVVYAALAVYGWHAWRHGGADHGALRVSRAPRWVLALLGAAAVAGTFVIGLGLGRYTDAALPLSDAATTSFSLAAQALQTRKWIENWMVWIVVDAVYFAMYVSQALYLTAALYAAFFVLAIVGLTAWRRSLAGAGR
jgi:nicotinamide mononucleotide transporter